MSEDIRKKIVRRRKSLSHALVAKEKGRQRFLTEPNRASVKRKKCMNSHKESKRKTNKELRDLPN